MGKQRRKFSTDFKRQVVQEVESGLSLNEVARRRQVSPSLIIQWRQHLRQGTLVDKPSSREKALEKELERYKAKVAELLMENDLLKKVHQWSRWQKKLDTSIITAKNLEEFQKDAGT
ncbi:MAG: transposase [Nitrososphaerales archaeon]|jgi:transposase-like protein